MGNSNKGRFRDRLKNILYNKKKKNITYDKNNKIEDSKVIYNNFKKVVRAIPVLVYGSIANNEEDNENKIDINDNVSNINDKDIVIDEKQISNNEKIKLTKKQDIDKINSIDTFDIKKKQDLFYGNNLEDKNISNDYNKVKELEKSIINLIKKDLIRIVNEMEILQSELYVLKEVNGESKTLKDCQTELDNVKSMICKIDKLKEKYDFLKDNYDFEYLLEIDNHDLVDKIIELRDTFGNNQLKAVSEDYKLLDAYKYLYLKIDDLQDKVGEFEEKKKEEELKLKERDIDFEKLKKDVYNVDHINRNYEYFVESQNDILKEIDMNVSKIDSYEQSYFKLKGFDELFKNSFKYFGLLMVSPLKGVIPAIATETLITGNIIKNLYKNLEWEESKKMVYEAIDYSNQIDAAIGDLESTNKIVDMTLDDIVKLKMKYNDKFRMYQGDFLEYREVMRKINDMENKIFGNKIKIEMMRKKALEQQMINQKKLKLVKELNSNSH